VSARLEALDLAEAFLREVESLYTNGPAGGGGVREHKHKVIAISSFLIPQSAVKPTVLWKGGEEV